MPFNYFSVLCIALSITLHLAVSVYVLPFWSRRVSRCHYHLFDIFISAVLVGTQNMTSAICCVKACRRLHSALISRILRAPMSFFDTTPRGRVLARFSQDMSRVDLMLRQELSAISTYGSSLLAAFIAIAYTIPMTIFGLIPFVISVYVAQVIVGFSFTAIHQKYWVTFFKPYNHALLFSVYDIYTTFKDWCSFCTLCYVLCAGWIVLINHSVCLSTLKPIPVK